jgi:hypothetical protein
MTEKSGRAYVSPATELPVRPGDFVLGSRKSRAAARALIQRRYRPVPPPWGTLNLSCLTVEGAQRLYAKISVLPGGQMLGTPWFPIRWPDGFKPGNQPISTAE